LVDTPTQPTASDQSARTSATKSSPKPFVEPPTQQKLKVEAGPDAGTLKIDFPAGTTALDVVTALGGFGLTILSGDAKTGQYVFALPKIDVYVQTATTANASD